MHAAAFGGNTRVLQLLVNSGKVAAATATTDNGQSLLHYAAMGGSKDVTQMLLQAGCSIKAADADGNLPWHLAAQRVSAV